MLSVYKLGNVYMIQDTESRKYFHFHYLHMQTAEMARDMLRDSWNRNVFERSRDMLANFVSDYLLTLRCDH